MLKMFNLINIGERAGSGIPNILSVWSKQGWMEPIIKETFEPERASLILSMIKNPAIKIGDKKSAIKIGDKKSAINKKTKRLIIEYLTVHVSASCVEIAKAIGLKESRTREYLKSLVLEDILVSEGANRNRKYFLKK